MPKSHTSGKLLPEQISVHQLWRNQRYAKHDTEDRCTTHFSPLTSKSRPAGRRRSLHRSTTENRRSFAGRVHLRQRLTVAHGQIADHIAKTEDQTTTNQRGQQWEEDLREMRDQLLMPFHILPGGFLPALYQPAPVRLTQSVLDSNHPRWCQSPPEIARHW